MKTPTRADYMDRSKPEIDHATYYRALARTAGVSFLYADEEFLERVREALRRQDDALNSIPLKEWDMKAAALLPGAVAAFKKHGDTDTLAGRVSMLKQAARDAVDPPWPFEMRDTGRPLRFWDDGGDGPWWLYCETLGPVGCVRADTWEAALECVQDEIMDGCTYREMCEELDLSEEEEAEILRTGNLPEGFGYRSSGEPSNEGISGELYREDLNGSSLAVITPETLTAYRLRPLVRVQHPEDNWTFINRTKEDR